MRFKVKSDGDLCFENGRGSLTNSTEQRLRQRLRLIRGEWFLNVEDGVPYFTDALGNKPSTVTIESSLKREILLTLGVSALLSYSQEVDTEKRQLILSARVKTSDGEIININEVL